MTDFIRVIIPIAWVLLSAAVGLALYKYSAAKVETRWVVLTGAASIFVVTFFGLYKATPESLLRPKESQAWQTMGHELQRLDMAVSALREKCLGQRDQLQCQAAIEEVQTDVNRAHGIVWDLTREPLPSASSR